MMQLEQILPVSRLSTSVIRLLGMNPHAMTLQGTNTYLVGQGVQRVLIDTGQGVGAYLENLVAVLKEEKCSISRILITHCHIDHTGAIKDILQMFPGIPVQKNLRYHLQQDEDLQNETNIKYTHIENNERLPIDDSYLECLYAPGHSVDHVGFYFPKEDAYFSGDCILGNSSTGIENLKAYVETLRSLHFLQMYYVKMKRHGCMYEGQAVCQAVIQQILAHRQAREDQIVACLKLSEGRAKIEEIFSFMYAAVKDETLIKQANQNLLRHLEKLQEEGKVSVNSERMVELL